MLHVEGFRGNVATDGSLSGKSMGCMAESCVQRPTKRAELTAFLCFLKKVIGPVKVHVDNKGIINGLRKGEKECIKPRAGDADLCIKSWEELQGLVERGILVEVEHLKAHRTPKHVAVWEVCHGRQ